MFWVYKKGALLIVVHRNTVDIYHNGLDKRRFSGPAHGNWYRTAWQSYGPCEP